MYWMEHVIFAMAPLGILTAIVSAIRVGGPPWLRAVVGRVRENLATVELELMSSTSHEVCELWNGQGIVRAMGMPEVQEIIYLEGDKDENTCGLHTIETAYRAKLIELKRMYSKHDYCSDSLTNITHSIRRSCSHPFQQFLGSIQPLVCRILHSQKYVGRIQISTRWGR